MPLEIFHTSLAPLIQFLHNHPNWAGFITFFVVFCEAMAVIGVIVPGTVTMTAIGMLVGTGVIDATSTFTWAIIGAICGDYLSYILGVYYKDRLHYMWPFKKHPKLLIKSEKFFADHGGKSVMIGRFIGPMRAMIPMIAGMLKMPQGRFLLAAIPSASIWAVSYILPGTILGALTLQLPAKVATKFMLVAVLTAIIIWLIIWLLKHFFKQICQFVDQSIMQIWLSCRRNKCFHWLTNFLADPHYPDNHNQLTLLFTAIVTLILFGIIMFSVITHGPLTAFNDPLYNLLASIRGPKLDKVMLFFTFLAETKSLVIAQLIFILWLCWKRYWYIAMHALGVLLLLDACVEGCKFFTHIARPNNILSLYLGNLSFPSGHVSTCIAVYGFLAILIAPSLNKNLRWLPHLLVTLITTLVLISRLYLGAHWLTDVIGGVFLGTSILTFITISYRRSHEIKTVPPVKTATVATLIFASVLIAQGIRTFQYQFDNFYTNTIPKQIITHAAWQTQLAGKTLADIPLYRTNRLGYPANAFNVQWLGNLDEIEQTLIARGWQSQSKHLNPKEILRRLTVHPTTARPPIVPQLYHNRKEALLLIKNSGKERPQFILRLWYSDIIVTNANKNQTLWLGVITEYTPSETLVDKNITHKPRLFLGAAKKLLPVLETTHWEWKKITVPTKKQPSALRNLHWDGDVLFIH